MKEKPEQNQKIEELKKALGTTAEMALIFMRSALDAGASEKEAADMTRAFIAAVMFSNGGQRKEMEE
jgi:hypothetical protein